MEYKIILSLAALMVCVCVSFIIAFFKERRKKHKKEQEKKTILAHKNRLERQKEALHQLASYNGLFHGSIHHSVMRIAEIASTALSVNSISFWYHEPNQHRLLCYERYHNDLHFSPEAIDLSKHDELFQYLCHSGTQVISESTSRSFFSRFRILCDKDTRSLLFTSIFVKGIFRGVFCVERSKQENWFEDEKTFSISIADHLTTALLLHERTGLEQELLFTSAAVSSAQDGIAILDYEGRFIFANSAYCRLHGYSEQNEIEGKPWFSFYEDDELQRFRDHLLPQLRAKGKLTVETIGKKRSGRVFPQELSLSIINGDKFVIVVRDITIRKRVEKNAHELALFTTLNPSPVIRFNQAGKIVLANPAAVDIFGIHRRQDIQDIIPTLSQEKIAQCIQKGRTETFTDTIRDKKFYITLRGLSDLNIAHLYANDVTALDTAERKLDESEKFLRLIIDSDPSAIFVKDRKGRYTLVNTTTANLFGKSINEVLGRTDSELLPHGEQADNFREDDKEVLFQGKEKRIRREQLTDSSGNSHIFQTVKRPLFLTHEDSPSHILGVATDITETQSLQDKLNQSMKMDAIGQLAGGIAHDFNNLLTGILGYTEVLKLESKDNPELSDASKNIETIALRAAELTQKLLGFARKGKHKNIATNVHEIIDETLILLERTIDKRIQLEKRFHAKNATIKCDPTQIQQILLNITLNARDAMSGADREGTGGVIFIDTEQHSQKRSYLPDLPERDGNYLKISISDTGKGIPPENLTKIFEPFFTTKSMGKGTGMGLAMVYGIVENHGGTIQVQSVIDKGTTFEIYLPLTDQKEEVVALSEKVTIEQYGHGNILLADDHHMIRDVTSRMLNRLGYTVITAKDGLEAIDLYEQHNNEFDLVILDMIMPRMGAKECFEKIRSINPNARVILSTGYVDNHAVQNILSTGMIGFVQKPFQIDSLSRTIAEALQH